LTASSAVTIGVPGSGVGTVIAGGIGVSAGDGLVDWAFFLAIITTKIATTAINKTMMILSTYRVDDPDFGWFGGGIAG